MYITSFHYSVNDVLYTYFSQLRGTHADTLNEYRVEWISHSAPKERNTFIYIT